MLRQRLIYGPAMIAALLVLVWLDDALSRVETGGLVRDLLGGQRTLPPGLVLLVLGLLVSVPVAQELATIFKACGVRASARSLWASGAVGQVFSFVAPQLGGRGAGAAAMATAAIVVLVAATVWHLRHREIRGAAGALASSMFAFVYLGLMFGFLLALRHSVSAWVILGVLAVTKSSDIGAFFVGSAIGRHKLIPWLSPGKTWEGLAGGIVGAAVVGAAGALAARSALPSGEGPGITWWEGALVGAAFALIGQAGDLLASLLKRDAGVKDSGAVIPGFGGAIDVVDSLLLVAPVAYWLLQSP